MITQQEKDEKRKRILKVNEQIKKNYVEVFKHFFQDFDQCVDEIRMPCPVHKGDNLTGFVYWTHDGKWRCFTHNCHEYYGDDPLGLIRGMMKKPFNDCLIDIEEAIKKLNIQDINVILKEKPKKSTKRDYYKDHINQPTFPDFLIKNLSSPIPYCNIREIDVKIAQSYGCGYAKNYDLKGRFVIPVRNINQKIVGFTARKVYDELPISKWQYWPGTKRDEMGKRIKLGFQKNINFFNIENVVKYKKQTGCSSIILLEGPFDVIKAEMAGVHNTLAILGDNVSIGQIEILKKLNFVDVYLCLDPDKAGIKGETTIRNKLEKKLFCVHNIKWNKESDWGDKQTSVDEIKQCIIDNKVKII